MPKTIPISGFVIPFSFKKVMVSHQDVTNDLGQGTHVTALAIVDSLFFYGHVLRSGWLIIGRVAHSYSD